MLWPASTSARYAALAASTMLFMLRRVRKPWCRIHSYNSVETRHRMGRDEASPALAA